MRECCRVSPEGHRGSYKLRALAFGVYRRKGSVALIHGERLPTRIFFGTGVLIRPVATEPGAGAGASCVGCVIDS